MSAIKKGKRLNLALYEPSMLSQHHHQFSNRLFCLNPFTDLCGDIFSVPLNPR